MYNRNELDRRRFAERNKKFLMKIVWKLWEEYVKIILIMY